MEFYSVRAELSAIASTPPTHQTWSAACCALDELTAEQVRAHVAALEDVLAAWPSYVRTVTPPWTSRLRAEGNEPRVLLCRTLDLSSTSAREDLRRALESDDIQRITELNLSRCGIDASQTADLARQLARTDVTSLSVKRNDLGVGLCDLLRLSARGKLVAIDAESCVDNRAMVAIAAQRPPMGLRRLSLATSYLDATSVEYLAALPGFGHLDQLSLSGNKFLSAGVTALAVGMASAHLRRLDLEATQCSDDGSTVLAQSAPFARLNALSLMSCNVGDAGAAALAGSSVLLELTELDLHFNDISAAGAALLFASPSLVAVTTLRLDGNPLGDEIVDALATRHAESRLEHLLLDQQSISEETRAAIMDLPSMRGVAIDFA